MNAEIQNFFYQKRMRRLQMQFTKNIQVKVQYKRING